MDVDLKELIKEAVREVFAEREKKPAPAALNLYLSPDEAADYLGCCKHTLYRYSQKGILKHSKIGKRYKFRHVDLDEFMLNPPEEFTMELAKPKRKKRNAK